MNTQELLEELKELVDSEDKSAKSEIQRICGLLKGGNHDRYFLASGKDRKRWEEHISWIESYSKHPNHIMKARSAVSMMRSDLPEQ
jgi:hypothetical protein